MKKAVNKIYWATSRNIPDVLISTFPEAVYVKRIEKNGQQKDYTILEREAFEHPGGQPANRFTSNEELFTWLYLNGAVPDTE